MPGFLPAMTIEEGIVAPELKKAWELTKANRPADALRYLSEKKAGSSTGYLLPFYLRPSLGVDEKTRGGPGALSISLFPGPFGGT